MGRGVAAAEVGAEEAGPERQRLGRGGSGLAGEQRPWRKRMRKQGRRGSRWAGSQQPLEEGLEAGPERQRLGWRGSGLAREAAASGGRVGGWAGEAAAGPER